MKKLILATALLLALAEAVADDGPAALSIQVFDRGEPVAMATVSIDGREVGRTDDWGGLRIEIAPGDRELVLRAGERDVLRLELELTAGEIAQLIASVQPDGPAQVQYETSAGGQAGAAVAPLQEDGPPAVPGTIAGRVVSSDGGRVIANARVYVSGTPLDIRTDADGRFRVELPPGTYALSVIAADHDTRSFEGIAVVSGETLSREVELTPAGVELPEFVVLEPFVEGSLASLVEERRESASVADFLGAEQISRAGDSDAAGALKRVTGLTLVDGKYIYVRGLGERYSSVLLNGAQIPSPDPTRRVVPLDLFPTDVIDSVLVQKTYSAEMPGEFGGGTIALRTRNAPEDFFFKASVTSGYTDGTTGEQGLTYAGGSRDWTGYDDGARAPQGALATLIASGTPLAANPPAALREQIGEDLAGNSAYTPFEKRIEPSYGFALGIGDSFDLGWVKFGGLASVRYDNSWDVSEEVRASYTGENLTLNDRFDVRSTTQDVELSGFLNLQADIGDHHRLRGNLLLARVTEDEVQIQDGISDSQDQRRFRLEWIENQLRSGQVGGEHTLPFLAGLEFNWQYTQSQARRDEPNRRTYAYLLNPNGDYALDIGSSGLVQSFASLVDDADGYDVSLRLPMEFAGARWRVAPSVGISNFERDRESRTRSFGFTDYFRLPPGALLLPLERILSADNIGPVGVRVRETTQLTENYIANQGIDARFAAVDVEFAERYRLAVGLRQEKDRLFLRPDNFGVVPPPNQVVDRDQHNSLPFASGTWKLTDAGQLRVGYSETLSRPDFRELSAAPYTDPQLDLLFFGNPRLATTQIRNYDLRYEHYFSPAESVSLAVFKKEFKDPIEKSQRLGGSGPQGTLINAEAADLTGIEVDFYRTLGLVEELRLPSWFGFDRVAWDNVYVSGNYARIESDIQLDRTSIDQVALTSESRPLQGQSPYVANLQVGYQNQDAGREYSLLFNRFGARISQVGIDGAPDIYEQPVNQLDAVFQQRFWNDWSLKVRLRNLLDPDVRFLQGGLPTRQYRRGREILLTLEWKP